MGNRLQSVISDWPKPMVEVNHRPFLDVLVDYFAEFGFRRFVLCVGHMSEVIRNYYSCKAGPLEFVISDEQFPLGTAGSVKNAENFIQSDPFIVTNGDSFCAVNLTQFCDFHLTKKCLMSMVVVESENSADCGLVSVDNLNRIVGFEEKRQKQGYGHINAGIYLFRNDILSFIPPDTKYSLEHDLFPKLINQDSYAFVCREKLIDIGTPERLELAKNFFSPM